MKRRPAIRLVAAVCFVALGVAAVAGCQSGAGNTSSSTSSSNSSSLSSLPPVTTGPPSSSTTSTTASSAGTLDLEIGMGGADGVRLSSAWRQAAADGRFTAETTSPDRLEIAFSSAGDLVHFLVVARTEDQKQVTLGWSGFGGAPDQNVMITGTVAGDAPTTPLPTPDRVSSILLAVDTVRARNMIAKLPAVGSGGYYAVAPLLGIGTIGGNIPRDATAYIWDGSGFAPLSADDPRRDYDSGSVHLKVTADPSGQSLQTGTSGQAPATAYFVVTGAMLSTTTTAPLKIALLNWLRLEVNPRPGVRVAVGGLKQEAGALVVHGEIIIDNQSDTPFLYRAGDFHLYLEDAILAPTASAPILDSGEVKPGATPCMDTCSNGRSRPPPRIT